MSHSMGSPLPPPYTEIPIYTLTPTKLFTLASDMDVCALQEWRARSNLADCAAAHALDLRFNIALSRFVKKPLVFRDLMRLTSAVISGSTALHVLDGDRSPRWTPSDLDIYTPRHSFHTVIDFLQNSEDYTMLKEDVPDVYPYDNPAIGRVVHLSRDDHDIDVIQSTSASALQPLPHFWSSHLMNYLSADGFCIAYPDLTLSGRGLLMPVQLYDMQYPRQRTLVNIAKYHARGYDFRTRPLAWLDDVSAECNGGAACPRSIRFFGDLHCLLGSFQPLTTSCEPRAALPDPFLTTRWSRGGCACGGLCRYTDNRVSAINAQVNTISYPVRI